MLLPNFIVIGSMKAATTSIFKNLAEHPDIHGAPSKELNYFTENYNKNIEWYHSKFDPNKFNGESSPSYTRVHEFPDCPKKMFDLLPNVKLIYVLRDPISRLISHLHHDLYRDRIKSNQIEEVLTEDNTYIKTSLYYFQISKYLEFYSPKNIFFVKFEDYLQNSNLVLNEICDFLKLSNYDFQINSFNTTENRYWIKNFEKVKTIKSNFVKKLYHTIFYFVNKKFERPKLSQSTLTRLAQIFSKDLEKLENDFGITTYKL